MYCRPGVAACGLSCRHAFRPATACDLPTRVFLKKKKTKHDFSIKKINAEQFDFETKLQIRHALNIYIYIYY